jgi:hypothetical protein
VAGHGHIPRSNLYYRRRAKARQDVALAVSISRATFLADQLAADLARCVIANAAMARELGLAYRL